MNIKLLVKIEAQTFQVSKIFHTTVNFPIVLILIEIKCFYIKGQIKTIN